MRRSRLFTPVSQPAAGIMGGRASSVHGLDKGVTDVATLAPELPPAPAATWSRVATQYPSIRLRGSVVTQPMQQLTEMQLKSKFDAATMLSQKHQLFEHPIHVEREYPPQGMHWLPLRHDRTHGSDGQKALPLKSTGRSQRDCDTTRVGRRRHANKVESDGARVGNMLVVGWLSVGDCRGYGSWRREGGRSYF